MRGVGELLSLVLLVAHFARIHSNAAGKVPTVSQQPIPIAR
jgi:hypothetical protein